MWNEAFNCSGEAQERVYPFRLVNSVRILSSSWRIIEMANELLRAVASHRLHMHIPHRPLQEFKNRSAKTSSKWDLSLPGDNSYIESKGSPELIQPSIYATDSEVIAKVQGQLLGAITLLDALQDGICFFVTLFYLISSKQKKPTK
uniref:Beclin-1 n=1 Tax=Ascaris lumbricoides TaxID=6252 RepID=A0A0M3I732_ASCLU